MLRLKGKRVTTSLLTGVAILGIIGWSPLSGRVIAAQLAAGYNVSTFATNPPGASEPDSLAVDGNNVFVGYGDGVAVDGSDGKSSTVVQYNRNGQLVTSFSVLGHNDGLRIDPNTHLVYALSNEDGNPNLTVIDPSTRNQKFYTFPTPDHGGGYDDLAFLNGQIFISASAPANNPNTATALGTLSLNGSTATVTPVLAGNATAVDITTGKTVTLNLQDPDSLGVTPQGGLTLTSQADNELIFIANPGTPQQQVSVLPNLTTSTKSGVDDTVYAPKIASNLFITDRGGAIYQVSGPFAANTAYTAAPDDGVVGALNTQNGTITPIISGLSSPHGLAFVPVPEPNSALGLITLGAIAAGLQLKRLKR